MDAIDDQALEKIVKTFMNALRKYPKEPALDLFVATVGYVPDGYGRRCTEVDIAKALGYALKEHSTR